MILVDAMQDIVSGLQQSLERVDKATSQKAKIQPQAELRAAIVGQRKCIQSYLGWWPHIPTQVFMAITKLNLQEHAWPAILAAHKVKLVRYLHLHDMPCIIDLTCCTEWGCWSASHR